MSTVSRVGDTVRRQSGPWSKQVHFLLAHLCAKGIGEVPAPLGFDDQGREILTYLPGQVGHVATVELRSEQILVSAARLLRRIHDASEEIAHAYPSGWQAPTRDPVEVICHGDFAPYNCVFHRGVLTGVIDFDHAHPGSRLWDLAYALYRFAPITDPSNPEHFGSVSEQCRRARLFCDVYGLADRTRVMETVRLRVGYMADFLRQGADLGDQRMQANIAAGHLAIYTTDYAYIVSHAEQFQRALNEPLP